MLATLVDDVPKGPNWIYEMKYDGIRALAEKKGRIELYSRNLQPLNRQFPRIFEELKQIPATSFWIDGEIVALDDEGRPRFQLLQPRINVRTASAALRLEERNPAYYFLFDLIACEGYDLRHVTLVERKEILKALLPESKFIRYAEAVSGQGRKFFRLACEKGLEGVVAKEVSSTYHSQRSQQWLKIKCVQQREFVIGGYTSSGSRRYFGALLLGLFEDGKLSYVGRVGSGFDEKALRKVYEELKRRGTKKNPFQSVPKGVQAKSWVKPELACEVKFNEWTQGRVLRAPIFLGLRPDVDPRECRSEPPAKVKGFREKGVNLPYDFLSNLEKVLWPDEGYRKRDLIEFYHRISEVLVPHLAGRPMVLERYPDGIAGKTFYQKEAPEFLPEWIPTVPVESESAGKSTQFILCNDRRALVYLANLGCISQHPWSSRVRSLEHPDFLIIDLDPEEGVPFSQVCRVALRVREIVERVEMSCYPKTSGATGMHIIIPLQPVYSYEDVRTFAEIIARLTVDGLKEIATFDRSKGKRKNKVYFDFLQNGRGKTIASPYCLRPRPGATVSTPLEWREITPTLRPESFHIKSVFRRLERKGDLFEGVLKDKYSLHEALEKLQELWEKQRRKS